MQIKCDHLAGIIELLFVMLQISYFQRQLMPTQQLNHTDTNLKHEQLFIYQ